MQSLLKHWHSSKDCGSAPFGIGNLLSWLWLGLLLFHGCAPRNVHCTELSLSSGDVLIQEGTVHEGWVESGITYRLFVRRNGNSQKELLSNGGPSLIHGVPSTAVWRSNGWIVIKIARNLFYRREDGTDTWKSWHLRSNPELYNSVRSALITAKEPFEENGEHGQRLILLKRPSDSVLGIGERFQQFFLPYEIDSVDFVSNQVVAKRTLKIECLPQTLVFAGEPGQFGQWDCHDLP